MNANSTKYDADTTWTNEIADWRDLVGSATVFEEIKGIVRDAQDFFETATDSSLMADLAQRGPWMDSGWWDNKNDREANAYARRFSEWLQKAASSRVLNLLVARTTSTNKPGPYRVYRLFENFPSAVDAERAHAAAMVAAREILEKCDMVTLAKYLNLARAMSGDTRDAEKIAQRGVESTVRGFMESTFGTELSVAQAQGWKEALNAPSGVRFWAGYCTANGEFSSLQETMGKVQRLLVYEDAHFDPVTQETVHGVTVTLGWGSSGPMPMVRCVQKGTGRTHQSLIAWWNPTTGHSTARESAKRAIRVWRRKRC